MAKTDNLLFGTYVGLVLDVNDPDQLGRAKILVPGKNGTVFQGWNNLNTDITFSSVTPDAFPEDVLGRLKKTIPWARPATPLWGGGTGSFNNTNNFAPQTIPTEAAFSGFGGGVTPGVLAKTGNSGRSTGPHLDVRWGDKRYISAADADRYVLINGRAPSSFGVSSSYNSFESFRKSPHKGIDFRTPTGSSIQLQNGATFAGTFNDPNGGGTVVRINTPQGVMSLLHLSPGTVNSNYGGGPVQTPAGVSDNRITSSDGVNNAQGKFDDRYPIGSGGIPQDSKGCINPTDMYKGVLNIIKNNPNSIYNRQDAPVNGAQFGVTGGAESWANFWTRTGSYESSYCNSTTNRKDPGGSFGILQVGPKQIGGPSSWGANYPDLARSYGLDPNKIYTEQEILASADLAIRSKLFVGDAIMRSSKYGGYKVGVGPSNGLGATLGRATWEKLAGNAPLATGSQDPNRLVQRTTNQGVNAFGDVNIGRAGGPVGMFSTPAVGAKVWVMFEGGSPQRPIYFGQVYDPSNIQSYT